MKRKILIALNILCVLLILLFGGLLVDKYINSSAVPSTFGITPLKVMTGSMETSIFPGDIVIAKKTDINKVRVGDIISFYEDGEYVVTHRVKDIVSKDFNIELITKGDANSMVDTVLVNEEMLIGKVFIRIPFLGAIHTFMGSNFILATICIATVVVLFENLVKKQQIE